MPINSLTILKRRLAGGCGQVLHIAARWEYKATEAQIGIKEKSTFPQRQLSSSLLRGFIESMSFTFFEISLDKAVNSLI